MEGAASQADRGSDLLGRVALLATSATLLAASFRVAPEAATHGFAMVAVWSLYLAAFGCLVAAGVLSDAESRPAQALVAFGLALALVASVGYEIRVENPRYGSDSLALAHAGAQLLIEGENPYAPMGAPLGVVIESLGVPADPSVITRTLGGRPIDTLGPYPALHLLAYVPFVALGLEDLRWANLVFELAGLSAIWLALPRRPRLLVLPALLLEHNLTIEYTSGGVTDWLWVLPVILTAIALSKDRLRMGAFSLGLACAAKQQPWFAAPFVLVWLAHRAGRRGGPSPLLVTAGFGGLVVLGFLLPNLPFMIWSPGDWARGVLYPAAAQLVPAGQGLSLLASLGLVDLPAEAYGAALIALIALLLFLYARYFPRLEHLLWVLPAVVLFVGFRSLHNYFVSWLPIIILWAALHHQELRLGLARVGGHRPSTDAVGRVLSWGAAGAATAALGLLAFVVTIRSPLGIRFEDVDVPDRSAMVEEIRATVVNEAGRDVELLFDVVYGIRTAPWVPEGGNVLPAHATSTFLLRPAGPESIPIRSTASGVATSIPFRLQAHATGDSRFISSSVMGGGVSSAGLVNPRFAYWMPPEGPDGLSRPLGWLTTVRRASGVEAHLEPLDADGGLRAVVDHVGQTEGEWVEVGLHQTLRQVAPCYELELRHSAPYSEIEFQPTGAVGLQIHQGEVSLWFVPSTSPFIQTTDLPGGTRVVEMPARAGAWQRLEVPVAELGAAVGLDLGGPVVIKVFSALNQSRQGPLELWVRGLEETDCQTT
jgi:hypothetical protein